MSETNNSNEVVVSIKNLQKAFGDNVVLRDIDLDVRKGEVVVVLGPSGSGKSTMLRCINRLEHPTSGSIVVEGVDVCAKGVDLNKVRTHLGMVFQQFNLFPHLSVKKNVMLAQQKVLKRSKEEAEKIAVEELTKVGLAERIDFMPSQLSGGQQQRVAIARAVVNKPLVLLLDEPFSALDYKLRRAMQLEIKRLQRRLGITFVFVTHDQEEALAVADRIGVMNKGKIEQIAAPQNLYQRPATEYVATFIGLTNRLPGASNGDEAVVFGQRVPLLAGSAKGDSVAVLVRPENLTLALAGSSDSHVGERARVEVIHFLGSLVRVDTVITSGEYQRWNKGEQLKATVQLPASGRRARLLNGVAMIVRFCSVFVTVRSSNGLSAMMCVGRRRFLGDYRVPSHSNLAE